MITDRDVEKLKEAFVTKHEFNALNDDVETLKETTQQILTIVDGIAKKQNDQEILALKRSDELHTKQIQ